MSRSHFQALATLCADIITDNNFTKDQCVSIVDSFCAVCREGNPQFDSIKFDDWVQDILLKF